MIIRSTLLTLAFTLSTVVTGAALADDHHPAPAHEGEDLNVHNKTGHEVVVFMFQDDHVHLDEHGGIQVADIKDGASAVAHVPNCKFAVILIDHDDVWHAEFHDCHSTDMTFTKDTGHAKKAH